jgi:selenocysteine-specific elongation factor
MARVILLGGREELRPGESAYVQFRLESPVVTLYGDRYILRSYSPITTVGGGQILDSHPRKHRHHLAGIVENLEKREKGTPQEIILLVIEERGLPLSRRELLSRTELKEGELAPALSELLSQGMLTEIAGDGDPLYVPLSLLASLRERMTSLTGEKEALRQRMDAALPADIFETLLRSAVSAGMLEVDAGRVRVAGKGRSLSDKEREEKEGLLRAIHEGRFGPPMFKEMMESFGLDKNKLRDLLGILLEEGEIEQVNPDYFLARGRIAEAEESIRSRLASEGKLGVADVREMLGASRKYAIPLLEYFDRKRLTKRDGDYRIPF